MLRPAIRWLLSLLWVTSFLAVAKGEQLSAVAVLPVDLKFAVNTNWDVFQLTPANTLYLRNDKLPADDNWRDVRANLPGKQISPNSAPTVFVSFEPAELIQLTGEPAFAPVAGTSLLWVSNTESDLFKSNATGAFYYLIAGSWFSAPGLDGPWTFATLQLPKLFQKNFWYSPTYGFAAWYNPHTGTYGRGAAIYGPYGGAGGFAAYNPRTGIYARGGAVYGPYGSRGFAQAWNPHTGTYAATRQGAQRVRDNQTDRSGGFGDGSSVGGFRDGGFRGGGFRLR